MSEQAYHSIYKLSEVTVMKLQLLGISILIWLGVVFAAVAGEVTIEWSEPSQYTDVRTPYVDRDNDFLNVRFDRIEKHLKALGDMHFTKGESLAIRITDYEIAGDIVPQASVDGQPPLVRKKLMNDFPKMTLSFTLKDKQGNVISEGNDVHIEGRAIRTEGRS